MEENSDITPFKIQRLRAKYSEAFQKLERYRDDEATLLNRARVFTEELEDQRSTLAEDQYTEEVSFILTDFYFRFTKSGVYTRVRKCYRRGQL